MLTEDTRLLGQRQRTLLLTAQKAAWISACVLVPLAPKSHGPKWMLGAQWVYITAEEHWAWRIYCFIVSSKKACFWLILYPSRLLAIKEPWEIIVWVKGYIFGIPASPETLRAHGRLPLLTRIWGGLQEDRYIRRLKLRRNCCKREALKLR